jgi:predicted peptidase
MEIARIYEPGRVTVEETLDGQTRTVVIPYRLLRPQAGAPGVRHPLVVFLHGAGERGDDNLAQLKYLPSWLAEPALRQSHPCFVLAPQCRQNHRWAPFDWSDKRSSPIAQSPTPDLAGAIAALDRVLSAESIDPDRVLLTGLSMGGYGSWEWAMRAPERFAALVPICGGGDERQAGRLVNLPIWCFHGAADNVVPVERSRTMVEAIRAAGGSPRYSELPGVGHDSWTPAYRQPELLVWLFSQRRAAAEDR